MCCVVYELAQAIKMYNATERSPGSAVHDRRGVAFCAFGRVFTAIRPHVSVVQPGSLDPATRPAHGIRSVRANGRSTGALTDAEAVIITEARDVVSGDAATNPSDICP